MPQATLAPFEQTAGSPAAQVEKSQPSPPLPPGQSIRQRAPAWQLKWQLSSAQLKRQLEPAAQLQVPLAQTPLHCSLSPSHLT